MDAVKEVAQAILDQGYPIAAQRWIQHAIRLDAGHSAARVVQCDVFLALQDRAAAGEQYQTALDLDPKNARARQRLKKLAL